MNQRIPRAVLASVVLLAGAACDAAPAPDFHNDVAPILAANCLGCHQQGGIAPVPLTDAASAQAIAPTIAFYVENRLMPPYNVDNSGACRTYDEARWLDEDEIATIVDWAAAGAPLGTAAGPPPAAPVLAPAAADMRLMTPTFEPSIEPDHYRCFLLDTALDAPTYITGLQVRPGTPEMAHHMLLFSLDSAEAVSEAVASDAADPGPGYDCFALGIEDSVLGGDSRLVGAWAPGVPTQRFPAGTGVQLQPGQQLLAQMHYNTLNGIEPDQTAVELLLSDEVARPAAVTLLDDFALELAPGREAVTHTVDLPLSFISGWYLKFPEQRRELLGVFPHMHELGTHQRLVYEAADGSETCLHDVDRWDFDWQEFYFFAASQTVTMAVDGKLRWDCTYDTRGRSAPVEWGDGTQDEMCMVILYSVAAE